MAEFVAVELDYSKVSAEETCQIRAVYEHAFKFDIGLDFDASLDSDFTNPLAYYSSDARGAYFVIREAKSGCIVGTTGLRAIAIPDSCPEFSNSERNGRTCELKRMFILPVARGKGLAKSLVELALAKAKLLGFEVVVLDTKRRLEAANALYAKVGFTDCSNYNGNPRADRFMLKRLDWPHSLPQ